MRSDVVQGPSQRGDVITELPGLVWYAGEAGHRQYLCCFDLLVELYVDPLYMSITLPLHLLTGSLDAHCTQRWTTSHKLAAYPASLFATVQNSMDIAASGRVALKK